MALRKMAALGCAIAAMVMLLGPASAQQPSAAALATAREIVDVKGTSALFNPVISGILERARITFLQTNPNLQRDLDAVGAQLRTEYAPRISEIRENLARLYAQRFTEVELKDVLAFYKSPLGVKVSAEEPKFVDDSMKFMDDWAEKLFAEVVNKFRTEMKKKGHDI
jgi:hypothetical protein